VSVTNIRVTGGGLDIHAPETLNLHADHLAGHRNAWHDYFKEVS
jgi:hypothetical protein